MGMPPAIWARYSPIPIWTMQLLDLAEAAAGVHPLGIGGELAHRFDIGREPGEAMGGALLAVEQAVDHVALDRDALRAPPRRLGQQGLGHAGRLACERDQLDSRRRGVELCPASAISVWPWTGLEMR